MVINALTFIFYLVAVSLRKNTKIVSYVVHSIVCLMPRDIDIVFRIYSIIPKKNIKKYVIRINITLNLILYLTLIFMALSLTMKILLAFN